LAYSVATRRIPRTTAIEPFYDPDLVGRQAEAAREWQQAADQVLRENPLYDETRAALAAILDKAAIEIELFEEDWEKVADELTATQAAAIEKLNVALPDPLQDCPRDLTRGEGGVRAAAARPGESDLLLSLDKSQVSRLCMEIDDKIAAFLTRPLEGDWPYLWLDATYVKVRANGRIVSAAVIVAVAVNSDGRREVLGLAIGPSEAETFWTDFLRSLARRGLRGVKLVISDAHEGLKAPPKA
jgi:hypothetical protein